jgi:hypothetical protein
MIRSWGERKKLNNKINENLTQTNSNFFNSVSVIIQQNSGLFQVTAEIILPLAYILLWTITAYKDIGEMKDSNVKNNPF